MTGVIVLITVFVLLTTRTRRGRRRWRKSLGWCWLVLAWLATSALSRPSVTTGRPQRGSTRPQPPAPARRIVRKSRTWPAPPWRPPVRDPSAPRPGQGPRYFTADQKQELLRIAGYRCQWDRGGMRCMVRTQLRADHRHPYSWGGKTIIENGQILCDPHNVEKGAHWTDVTDPIELELVCVPHMLPRNRFRSRRKVRT